MKTKLKINKKVGYMCPISSNLGFISNILSFPFNYVLTIKMAVVKCFQEMKLMKLKQGSTAQ